MASRSRLEALLFDVIWPGFYVCRRRADTRGFVLYQQRAFIQTVHFNCNIYTTYTSWGRVSMFINMFLSKRLQQQTNLVQNLIQLELSSPTLILNRLELPSLASVTRTTDLNTWIAGSHGFAYSSMRATGNTSAAILLQSKHLIDTLTSTHISAWNATGDRFSASNFMKILRKKNEKVPQIFETLKYLLKIAKTIYWCKLI